MNQKLLITEIENADPRPFGPSATMHYSVILRTESGEELVSMISENLLRKSAISSDELDDLVGSHVSVGDQFDRDGVMTATAEERVEQVLDGTYRLLFISAANGKIVKSDVYIANKKKERADTNAALKIREQEKRDADKKAQALKRILERNTAKTESKTVEQTESEPNLETNDDETGF